MVLLPRRSLVKVGLLVSLCLIPALPGAETCKLEARQLEHWAWYESREDDPDFLFRMTSSQRFWMRGGAEQDSRPGEADFYSLIKKEPEQYRCKHPFRGVAKLGSDQFLFVFDSSDLESEGYDVLYFDSNRNGDLTDDKALQAMPSSKTTRFGPGSVYRSFPRAEMLLDVDGEEAEYACFFWVDSSAGGGALHAVNVLLSAAMYRDGEIALDGKRHRVVLLDFNSNGRFDDEFTVRLDASTPGDRVYTSNGDLFLVDPDTKDRRVYGYRPIGRPERQPVSKLLCVDGRFYDVQIAPSGETLTLTASQAPLGAVENPNARYGALLYNDEGSVLKVSGDGSRAVAFPEGKWKLLNYVIDLTKRGQERQSTWLAAYASKDYPAVEVRQGETVALPFGPPYRPVVMVTPRRGSPSQVRLYLNLVGCAGEFCTNLMVNGKRPGKPTFAIANPKGKIVERGNFEYG